MDTMEFLENLQETIGEVTKDTSSFIHPVVPHPPAPVLCPLAAGPGLCRSNSALHVEKPWETDHNKVYQQFDTTLAFVFQMCSRVIRETHLDRGPVPTEGVLSWVSISLETWKMEVSEAHIHKSTLHYDFIMKSIILTWSGKAQGLNVFMPRFMFRPGLPLSALTSCVWTSLTN